MRWLCVAITLVGIVAGALAQTAPVAHPAPGPSGGPSGSAAAATVIHLGDSIVALNGPWKFTIGDSPVDPVTHAPLWAEPGFDDSKWETVDLTPAAGAIDPMGGFADFVPGWSAKGHPGYWGYAWYRIRVRVEARPGLSLALAGPSDVDDGYQVFENGRYISSFGDFSTSGDPSIQYSRPVKFELPQAVDAGKGAEGATRVIAFRVWMQASTLTQGDWVGGFHNAPLLGASEAVAARHQVLWDTMIRTYLPQPIQGIVFGMLGLLALSLALFDRNDRVYLWIGALLLIIAIGNIEAAFAVWGSVLSGNFDVVFNTVILYALQYAGWVMVWRVWFQQRRPAWVPWTLIPLTLLLMIATLGLQNMLPGVPVSADHAFTLISMGIRFVLAGFMLMTVIEGIREQGIEGWLALPAVLLAGVSEFYTDLQFMHILPFWFPFGVRIRLPEIADFLLVVALSILLLRRLRQSIQRQRLIALDVKQAQEVQQVILPQARTVLPGLVIESEYRPARQVGGDFFQIIPHPSDGSLLIVAGDVAGKGLKAGMLVALLVGGIRSTSDWSQEPEVVLASLNQRLRGRGDAFATCQVLHIASSGLVKLANAGHLPPYRNGQPLEIEGSLPLGILDSPLFTSLSFQLAPGERLVLVSDGIAEATSTKGELFGFDRTHALLHTATSAAAIADAAQAFGQDDDISVITITSTAVRSNAAAGEAALAPA